jgi:hypothetical protein
MGGQFNAEFDQVKRSFSDLASQMQCPHHFKNATLEMDGGSFDNFSMEVITCCNEFQNCVEAAISKLVVQQNLMVVHGDTKSSRAYHSPSGVTDPVRPTPSLFSRNLRDGH